jgi:hypothetical protein
VKKHQNKIKVFFFWRRAVGCLGMELNVEEYGVYGHEEVKGVY